MLGIRRGRTRFNSRAGHRSYVAGDVDFIWGAPFAVLVEESQVHTVVATPPRRAMAAGQGWVPEAGPLP
jgi:pectin methylesterase-like acyl-CoA thioesterase